jgi:hypothetical protein
MQVEFLTDEDIAECRRREHEYAALHVLEMAFIACGITILMFIIVTLVWATVNLLLFGVYIQ